MAWSGAAPIDKVEVAIGAGPWQNARLIGQRHRHSWQWWELLTRIESPGRTTLRARATGLAGRTQPDRPHWNRLGYGGNAVQGIPLLVLFLKARTTELGNEQTASAPGSGEAAEKHPRDLSGTTTLGHRTSKSGRPLH